MNNMDCTSECYTDLSFMGVAFDPNCDIDLYNYLAECDDPCCFEDECCC